MLPLLKPPGSSRPPSSSEPAARASLASPVRESPFHIKGSAYLLHLQYVREHLPGGERAFTDALGTAQLRTFFTQSFFVTSWYDLMPLIEAGRVCAPMVGLSFEQFIRLRSRHQFHGDLHMFRKLILRVASPGLLASRIPKIFPAYLDFTECTDVVHDGNRVTGVLRGVPRPIADWLRYVSEEFVYQSFEVNGTKGTTTRWKATLASPKHGVLCDDWSYVVNWDPV